MNNHATSGKFLLFFLALTISITCMSQNIEEGYWGVKGGININKISNLKYNSSIDPGIHIGVFANFQFNKKWSMMHEVLFSTRGVALDFTDGSNYKKTFSYIDLPWTANYFLNKNFFINLGIQPSIYTYFKSPKSDTVVYNKDNVNTFSLGYIVGATFLGDNNWGFGVRFYGSIFPVFKLDTNVNKSYSLQAFVMYAVNKKKRRGKRH